MSIVPRRELLEWEHKRLIVENNPRVSRPQIRPLSFLSDRVLLYEGYFCASVLPESLAHVG